MKNSKYGGDDEKNLLDSKKYFEEDDDVPYIKKKEPTVKMTTSLYGSNIIKPNKREEKS